MIRGIRPHICIVRGFRYYLLPVSLHLYIPTQYTFVTMAALFDTTVHLLAAYHRRSDAFYGKLSQSCQQSPSFSSVCHSNNSRLGGVRFFRMCLLQGEMLADFLNVFPLFFFSFTKAPSELDIALSIYVPSVVNFGWWSCSAPNGPSTLLGPR